MLPRRAGVRPLLAVSAVSVTLVSLVFSSCGVPDSAAQSRRLGFTEREFKITVDNKAIRAGHVPVRTENHGTLAHELVAFRTDLPEDQLPMTADGTKVDEEGEGITHLTPEAENVLPDTAKEITITLRPGRYVFLCNLPLHYKQGMHTVVEVR